MRLALKANPGTQLGGLLDKQERGRRAVRMLAAKFGQRRFVSSQGSLQVSLSLRELTHQNVSKNGVGIGSEGLLCFLQRLR